MAATLHKWHRRVGLAASLFIAFLVVTGIMLQHSDDLKLPFKHLSNSLFIKYYGIKPNPITTYQLGNRTISHSGDNIYFSGKPITATSASIHGAVSYEDEIIIATTESLIVVNSKGELLDEITLRDGLVEKPLGIALSSQNEVIIRGINQYWLGNAALTQWQSHAGTHPVWTSPSITLPALRQSIESHNMSQQISLERFILDLHSGRFFGKYGIYIIDIAALLMLVLAVTGIWLWVTRR